MSEHNGHLPHEPLVFDDLEPVEVPVTIKGKDYVLKEASSDAAVKFRNANAAGATLTQDANERTKVTMGSIADSEPLLVSLCLFEVRKDDKGNVMINPSTGKAVHGAVALGWVRGLKNSIVKALFDKVMEISPGLRIGKEKKAEGFDPKEQPELTPDTSS